MRGATISLRALRCLMSTSHSIGRSLPTSRTEVMP
jgi:hypothetical protein